MSDTTRSSDQAVTLTIDIGGTGTKMITVDHQGRPTSERLRELTPDPATPDSADGLARSNHLNLTVPAAELSDGGHSSRTLTSSGV